MGPPHPRGAWQDALVSWGKISTVSAACAESFLCQGPGLEMPWVLGKGWGGTTRRARWAYQWGSRSEGTGGNTGVPSPGQGWRLAVSWPTG